MPHRQRQPISARHAFALAFDLAARRDAVHSIVVPLALWAPWIFAPAIIERAFPGLDRSQLLLVTAAGKLLDFLVFVVVTAMLRFRAKSVFNTPVEVHPAPVLQCYAQALRRAPVLYLAEALRNLAFTIALGMLFVPFLYLGFKLSMVTEIVVLRGAGPLRATQRSFRLTEARFERWLEMVAISVFLVVPIWFLMAVCFFAVPGSSLNVWFALGTFLSAAIMPVIQYAWTFFYLRLEEIDPAEAAGGGSFGQPLGVPAAAWRERGAQPQLKLVELRPEPEEEHERDS
jgi:hypothetical protein